MTNKFEGYFLYLEKKLKVYLGFSIFVEGTLVFNHDLPGVSKHGWQDKYFFLHLQDFWYLTKMLRVFYVFK